MKSLWIILAPQAHPVLSRPRPPVEGYVLPAFRYHFFSLLGLLSLSLCLAWSLTVGCFGRNVHRAAWGDFWLLLGIHGWCPDH